MAIANLKTRDESESELYHDNSEVNAPSSVPKAPSRRDELTRKLSQAAMAIPDELCDIPDDVYSMFFLSNWFGPAFWYAFYVTGLKMAFYGMYRKRALHCLDCRLDFFSDNALLCSVSNG